MKITINFNSFLFIKFPLQQKYCNENGEKDLKKKEKFSFPFYIFFIKFLIEQLCCIPIKFHYMILQCIKIYHINIEESIFRLWKGPLSLALHKRLNEIYVL